MSYPRTTIFAVIVAKGVGISQARYEFQAQVVSNQINLAYIEELLDLAFFLCLVYILNVWRTCYNTISSRKDILAFVGLTFRQKCICQIT